MEKIECVPLVGQTNLQESLSCLLSSFGPLYSLSEFSLDGVLLESRQPTRYCLHGLVDRLLGNCIGPALPSRRLAGEHSTLLKTLDCRCVGPDFLMSPPCTCLASHVASCTLPPHRTPLELRPSQHQINPYLPVILLNWFPTRISDE